MTTSSKASTGVNSKRRPVDRVCKGPTFVEGEKSISSVAKEPNVGAEMTLGDTRKSEAVPFRRTTQVESAVKPPVPWFALPVREEVLALKFGSPPKSKRGTKYVTVIRPCH